MLGEKSTISFIGIGFGAIALLLALTHFWAGSFSPKPSLEQVVAEKAISLKKAALSALKNNEIPAPTQQPAGFDLDQIISIATAVLGGLAIVLGAVGYAKKEPARVAGGAAALGGGAIAFQFLALALGAVLVAILIAAVLSNL